MRNKYTELEKNYIKKYWGIKPSKDIADYLNRKTNSLRALASKLGLTSPPYWAKEDIELLKEKYLTSTSKQLEKLFNRKIAYITHKANELRILKEIHIEWTTKEHEKLKELYPITPNKDLEKVFNRNAQAIKRYAHKHGFEKKRETYENVKNWTEAEIKYLKNKYKRTAINEMSEKLDRSFFSIYNKAGELGLKPPQKQSRLETEFGLFLDKSSIEFIEQFSVWKYKVDFYLKKYNLIIETYGDYWHCNPKFYSKPINNMQRVSSEKDPLRISYIKSKGFKVLIVWEYDFYNNIEEVKKQLRVVLGRNI